MMLTTNTIIGFSNQDANGSPSLPIDFGSAINDTAINDRRRKNSSGRTRRTDKSIKKFLPLSFPLIVASIVLYSLVS